MESFVIGIDIGTGSVKAVAVYANGETSSEQKTYTTNHTTEGYSEQAPEKIWELFIECINQLSAKVKGNPVAVSFSSAMHSLMVVDDAGKPLTPLIIWSDTRSAAIAESLKNTDEGAHFYTVTGTPIHPMSPLCKIKWLCQNNPDLLKKANKFISVKEYIWYKLFGVYEVDYSIASATGLFDIHNFQWYDKALSWAGIATEQLSKAVPTKHVRNKLLIQSAALLNLTTDMNFIIGASDGCLANVGSQAINKGTAAITIGSSGAVRMYSETPILQFPAMPFAYCLSDSGYICGGPVNNGGIVIKWLLKSFFGTAVPKPSHYKALFETIEKIKPSCNGLLFLPYLTGERAPVWDAKTCGTYIGLTVQHTAAHLMRAAVEGICFAIYHIMQMLDGKPTKINQLNVSGGFTNSIVWLQMLADVTGKDLHLYQTEDASALGAAYVGFQTFGIPYKTLQQVVTFKPCMATHFVYQQSFSIYKTLYPILKNTMHNLYQLNK